MKAKEQPRMTLTPSGAERESQRRTKIETVFGFELGDEWESVLLVKSAYGKLEPSGRELLLIWLDHAGKLVNPFNFVDMECRAEEILTKDLPQDAVEQLGPMLLTP